MVQSGSVNELVMCSGQHCPTAIAGARVDELPHSPPNASLRPCKRRRLASPHRSPPHAASSSLPHCPSSTALAIVEDWPSEEESMRSCPLPTTSSEGTLSAREPLSEGKATPTSPPQDVDAAPWEAGPWVVCAPRTPSLSLPLSHDSAATLSASASSLSPAPTPSAEGDDDAPPPLVAPGAVLRGAAAAYQVVSTLGQGVYGQVFRCREVGNGRWLAVKALRLEGCWGSAARNEARALARISVNDPNGHHLVRMFETFLQEGRLLVVMEALDCDLKTFIAQRLPDPLRVAEIATILRQLFRALRKLEDLDIVHLDIKPDNIMFGSVAVRGLERLTLVDFSCARSARAAAQSTRAQALWYRAPEVALGQGASGAADVWSVGCVAAELATARPLYPARSDAQLLGAVWRTHGALPAALLERPGRTGRFFRRSDGGGWALRECPSTEGCPSVPSLSHLGSLHLKMLKLETDGRSVVQILQFRLLVMRMLHAQHERRITPADALEHQFFKLRFR